MANIFRWGSPKNNERDYFSAAIISTHSTGKISEQSALKIPAVKAAVELISGSISQLPVYLYEENKDKSVDRIDDARIAILNEDSSEYEVAQILKKKLVVDYLLYGKAYILTKNDKLYHLQARSIQEELFTEDGVTIAKKKFVYHGVKDVELNEREMIVIDSGTNGVLVDGEEILGTALSLISYQSSIMKNGALPTGVLKASSRLTEPAINRLRDSFEGLYNGARKAGKTMILEEGLDFKALSMKPDELQMDVANKFIISEIARLFNIPESLLNSAANKYNSLEQNNLSFLQYCLAPVITNFESSFNKNLLTTYEKQSGYYFRFDTSELLRTTEKEKIDATSSAFTKGLISFNEARYTLDKPPVDDDFYLLNLGNVIRNAENGELTIPNMGVVDQKKEEKDGEAEN
ncbi:phage portal protein [Sporolactobacillus nakayamae]|uniref:Phage portal protein, HK97 family n=1 Tax=Sporolactobacillus nakayamae TaxID=269670 RepID=A0A1I2U0W1_9BACL|nr:phage portal protein [Sporolactobacillus nakayamae]SFG70795.1 phage portal protein, HK97 family [Sporolactobacillus nakayamae]